ncbi:transglutaminase family protein [Cytophagaceae bacterium DM2B3-1]|uniref:Transglutaminase family protein n=1 Tax=Xanthocytophaga flava TaxID=3048013 RepID=A0ABT7CVH5_9BACT|nr:transglutaminase family protein [Xanthocytophaga flavus]MDJ1496599.1 transglutaminase family protein [Xanthocytophaga flavus]
MAIKVAISHKTKYSYDRYINLGPHIFRLRPAPHSRTPIEGYSFKIYPENHFINWQQDPFGNYLARVIFPEKTNELRIEVEVIARMEVINPFDFFVEDSAEYYPFVYDEQLQKELVPYLEVRESGPKLLEWVEKNKIHEKKRTIDYLVQLNQQLNKDIYYNIRMESGVQTCEESLTRLSGSCRDSAWLLVQILRHLGIAARFVSGYSVQLKADVKPLEGPPGPGSDITDLHAWAEAYIPGAGWIGLDATSGLLTGEGHIPLSCTPDYASSAPVVGGRDAAESVFEFENKVFRIHEDPRVTKPYTDEQWNKIVEVGHVVEADLQAGDVRMTMGGEPTFVSIDDMESPEWNSAADGPLKRKLAYDLSLRLKNRFAFGGLLHFGQGKWYPGEPFPRWQYALYWRKDGLSLWRNDDLIAKETDNRFTFHDSERFMIELAYYLGIAPENIVPAYEDPVYWALEEGKIPVNLDPLDVNLKDSIERRTLAGLLERGMNNPKGFAVPLAWNYWNDTWTSCVWQFRRSHCFLIPGNSPVGMRLPLESLPYVTKNKREVAFDRSQFEDLPSLMDYQTKVSERYGTLAPPYQAPVATEPTSHGEEEKDTKKNFYTNKGTEKAPLFEVDTIRTALCVEEREGILYVFLPPTTYLEHYIDLITSIEATAEKLQMPVRIEGYAPPTDYRMQKLVVSPDPGVIEVNIHPSHNWQELIDNTTALYEEAFFARLGTEKFMVDGRHTGTGGGNHVTIGGAKPADSPILRRPDLLRSLITYWQHHPALSYLFSGPFIGPTSQAPRIDEGRDERLYEVELAFDQIPENEQVPFWMVDRIFRNLLVDITGNTHRTEFCIDKLYSPDSSTGRLGLLEFRAFDMPPHKHMNLVQTLLIRALVAKFWNEPYKKKLIRWGTELHDRFLLPHFAYMDMMDVVNDLKAAGYDFDISWFDPFFEFRFPHHGTITVGNTQLELRLGIEPWHVLGEELSNVGTARFVDSSLERLQVKVSGFIQDRHILICNGCRVPLRSTGVKGEYVAGVRYKAWNPPSALHPTVGVDSPLVFDIVDSWNNRILGGCTYFVSHPGGRSFDTYPVNSYEAESRRISRFWDFGHTPSQTNQIPVPVKYTPSISRFVAENKSSVKLDTPVELINSEYPNTLDLRRFWKAR